MISRNNTLRGVDLLGIGTVLSRLGDVNGIQCVMFLHGVEIVISLVLTSVQQCLGCGLTWLYRDVYEQKEICRFIICDCLLSFLKFTYID